MLKLKEAKKEIRVYGDDTIKWEHDGKLHLLHIQDDEMPNSPRGDDTCELDIMACFHSNYNLGDTLEDKDSEEFWRRLVRENVADAEIAAAAEEGKLLGIRIARNDENPELVDIYETYSYATILGHTAAEEWLEYEAVPKDSVGSYLSDDLTVSHCMTLMEPYAEWLPLWLYDHSGIAMSCGVRTYPYTDEWDSGQVGWIVALKKTIMSETYDYVLDENGERIRVEHLHENGVSTWSYQTTPLTEETWRERAKEIMKADVELYDQYLTGDVYGFTLYEAEPVEGGGKPDWEEVDSCWGFYGCDILTNGIVDNIDGGLSEALETEEYQRGSVKRRTVTILEFD